MNKYYLELIINILMLGSLIYLITLPETNTYKEKYCIGLINETNITKIIITKVNSSYFCNSNNEKVQILNSKFKKELDKFNVKIPVEIVNKEKYLKTFEFTMVDNFILPFLAPSEIDFRKLSHFRFIFKDYDSIAKIDLKNCIMKENKYNVNKYELKVYQEDLITKKEFYIYLKSNSGIINLKVVSIHSLQIRVIKDAIPQYIHKYNTCSRDMKDGSITSYTQEISKQLIIPNLEN